MMNFLQLFYQYNIPVDWSTIYVGSRTRRLHFTDINEFATLALISESNLNEKILAISWEKNEQLLEKLLKEIVGDHFNEESEGWQTELRKFRFILLKKEEKSSSDKEILLQKIADVYSDFDYPPDMEKFIYYMPATDNYNSQVHSKEDNLKRMIALFQAFLQNEESELTTH